MAYGYQRYQHPQPYDYRQRYTPIVRPTPPPRRPFPPSVFPGVAPGPATAPGLPRPAAPRSHPYSVLDYLKSLGYPSIDAYLHGLGLDPSTYQPLTDEQIQAKAKGLVDAQINPLLDRLNADYAGRSKLGIQAIQSLTGMLAGLAGQYGPTVGSAYDSAIANDKALAGALADRLGGEGQSQGSELGGKLQQAGQDTSGAGQIADVGKFAGNAGFAQDTAALEALVAHSAAAQEYGAKLPFIEGLEGTQAGREFQASLMAALGQDIHGVTDQVPGLLQGIVGDITSRDQAERDRAQAATQARGQAQLDIRSGFLGEQQRRGEVAHRAQVEAENRRRYQDSQTRQREADRQTMLHNFEVRTGYRGVLTPTGVTYQRVNGQKVPTQATRDRAYNTRQTAIAQKQKLADIKTARSGYEWGVDAQGRVRPVDADPRAPGVQKSWTQAGQANRTNQQTAALSQIVLWGVDDKGHWTPEGRKAAAKVLGHDPGPVPPGVKPAAPPDVNLQLSRAAGVWVDSTGTPIPNPPSGKPPPLYAPKTKKPITVSVTLSKAAGRWVDSSGNPVNAPGLPPAPPKTSSGDPAAARRKAVSARNDAYDTTRQSISREALDVINAHPGLSEGTPAWKAAYASLYKKYWPSIKRYTSQAGQTSARKQLDQWIRAALKQPGTRQPSRTSDSGSGSGPPKHFQRH